MLEDCLMDPTNWRMYGSVIIVGWLAAAGLGRAQQGAAPAGDGAAVVQSDLPNAPSAMLSEAKPDALFGSTTRTATGDPAKKYHRIVQPNEVAEPLTVSDKLELSVMSRLTASDLASTAFSAGWSQMRDSAPHYGTDSGAFGERLGALALKQTTQSIFSYGIYASMFHDDPRYYVMGRTKNAGVRALYSASRVFIAQKDNGNAAANWPKFAGIASATALTNAYYPTRDHGFANGATAFGVSLWTSILNNEIHEFIGDGIRLVRHNR